MRKLQEEAANEAADKKETETIKLSYELMEELMPEMDKKSLVKHIAKKFKNVRGRKAICHRKKTESVT